MLQNNAHEVKSYPSFVRLRQTLAAHEYLARKLAALEKKYDDQFKIVFKAIAERMTPPESPRKKIGFDINVKIVTHGN